ncbi:MAG: PAS domain-containing protein [Candidatus Omnitrophica bacterium]|nr:PAS domain-containing protein [Candidatus Omnitrophota bacterium]
MRVGTVKSYLPKVKVPSNTLRALAYPLRKESIPRKNRISSFFSHHPDYKTIVDFSYDWEIFFDKDGKVLYSSPGMKRMIGFSAEEYLSEKIGTRDFVHKDDEEKLKRYFHRLKIGKSFNDAEFRFCH